MHPDSHLQLETEFSVTKDFNHNNICLMSQNPFQQALPNLAVYNTLDFWRKGTGAVFLLSIH